MAKRPNAGYVPIGDGKIYYETSGSGPVLVLIHGAAVDRRFWDYQVEPLAKKCFVVRYDRRCHGNSSDAVGPYSDHGDLVALLDHLGIEKAILCAHSGGGRAAFGAVFLHAQRVAGLISASGGSAWVLEATNDPVLESPAGKAQIEESRRWRELAIQHGVRAAVEEVSRSDMFARTRTMPDVWEKMRRMFLDFRGQNWIKPVPGSQFHGESEPLFRKIEIPTLSIAGAEDASIRIRAAEVLASWVPGARFEIIPNAGHPFPMENPKAFNKIVLDFVSGVKDATNTHS